MEHFEACKVELFSPSYFLQELEEQEQAHDAGEGPEYAADGAAPAARVKSASTFSRSGNAGFADSDHCDHIAGCVSDSKEKPSLVGLIKRVTVYEDKQYARVKEIQETFSHRKYACLFRFFVFPPLFFLMGKVNVRGDK